MFLLCDPRDLGVAERLKDLAFACPALYVYDGYPGGIGLAEGFFQNAAAIFAGALELAAGCACAYGCPSCIGPLEAEPRPSRRPWARTGPPQGNGDFLPARLGRGEA